MDLHGVGPVVAARILADVGDVTRFVDRNRFASWTGTAPLDAVRGAEQAPPLTSREPTGQPHDPHRRGHPATTRPHRAGLLPTQALREQETDGSHAVPEATNLRCDLPPARRRRAARRRCGPGRALRGVSRLQRGRPSPAHRRFGSATSRTRETDATTVHVTPEVATEEDPADDRLTTEGSRNDCGEEAAHEARSCTVES